MTIEQKRNEIEELAQRVKNNFEEYKVLRQQAEQMKQTGTFHDNNPDAIDLVDQINSIVNENKELINRHLVLTEEIRKEIEKNIFFDEIFDRTIKGELNFDKNHIFFKDEIFREMLLNQWIYEEKYENCTKLVG